MFLKSKLNQCEYIFQKFGLTILIKYRLKEIIEMYITFKIEDLNYSSTKKNCNFSNYSLPTVFLGDMYK